ncbi:MAG: hypothetical protein M3Q37_02060 [Gemmatimonadota bacterium]|nr:hypothetical protein [Gemmatimonadota bacterium]
MAAEAVALRVAGDTALEILPRRLAVAQDEPLLGIVESRIEPPSRGEPGAHVTVGAKLPGVVAITAARLPAICRGGVAREEAGRMIARRGVRGVGPVAVETLRPDMTAATGLRPRVGNRAVHIGKITAVRRRAPSANHRSLTSARTCRMQSMATVGLPVWQARQLS